MARGSVLQNVSQAPEPWGNELNGHIHTVVIHLQMATVICPVHTCAYGAEKMREPLPLVRGHGFAANFPPMKKQFTEHHVMMVYWEVTWAASHFHEPGQVNLRSPRQTTCIQSCLCRGEVAAGFDRCSSMARHSRPQRRGEGLCYNWDPVRNTAFFQFAGGPGSKHLARRVQRFWRGPASRSGKL